MLDHFNVYRTVLLFDQGRYWWVKVILVALPVLVVKGKIRHVNTLGFLAILAIVVYGAFCVTNFFMTRYILMVLPLMALLVVWGVEQIWNNAVFMILIIALLGFASVKYMDPNEFNYDCDLSYKRMLNVEQRAATYIDNHISPDSSIASNFPMNVILGEKNTGFIVSNLYFTRASNPSALYIVEGNNTEQVDIPKNNYDVERSFKDGFAEVVLWKRR